MVTGLEASEMGAICDLWVSTGRTGDADAPRLRALLVHA